MCMNILRDGSPVSPPEALSGRPGPSQLCDDDEIRPENTPHPSAVSYKHSSAVTLCTSTPSPSLSNTGLTAALRLAGDVTQMESF